MARGATTVSRRQDTHRDVRKKTRKAADVALIEIGLKKLAQSCVETGLSFQARQYGVKYCCLFMLGSNFRYICPYVEEETVHICEKGTDTMRYKCTHHR